jgi:LysR family transcriptional regulator, cys regulon transcriptional activator
MTLTQLRYLCEIVRQRLHLSNAANALNTSQPGVSKQIQLLEQELGCVIFKRKRNRLLGLTPAGEEIYRHARMMLLESENIRSVGRNSDPNSAGRILIAATRTQARYLLPEIIQRFIARFSNIQFEFWQGTRRDVFARVDSGDAHGGIALDGVAMLKYGLMHYSIIVQTGHPLLRFTKPPLHEVAKYPIITHTFEPDGQWKLGELFEKNGLRPNIVFCAADADVCKAYVELGLGIAILASIAFDKSRDRSLRAIRAGHLFDPEPLCIGINRKRFVSSHLFELIRIMAPEISRSEIEMAMNDQKQASTRNRV